MTIMKIRGAASEPRCARVSSPPISLSLARIFVVLTLTKERLWRADRLNARVEPELDSDGSG
jgi:hypothetical protein